MSLTTSYFAVAQRLKDKKISIARFNPPRLVRSIDEILTHFAPTVDLLQEYKKGRISWAEYQRRYTQEQRQHYRIRPEHFFDILERATKEDLALLCYERFVGKNTLCHRFLLYEMLQRVDKKEKYGVKFVDETSPNKL